MTKQERDQYMFNLHYGLTVNDSAQVGYIDYVDPITDVSEHFREVYRKDIEEHFKTENTAFTKHYKIPIIKAESKEQFMERMAEESGHKQPLYVEEDLVPSDIFSNSKYLKD